MDGGSSGTRTSAAPDRAVDERFDLGGQLVRPSLGAKLHSLVRGYLLERLELCELSLNHSRFGVRDAVGRQLTLTRAGKQRGGRCPALNEEDPGGLIAETAAKGVALIVAVEGRVDDHAAPALELLARCSAHL